MPTRDTAWPAGTPCWIDYAAADVDAAKDFYSNVLGWTYTGGEPEYGGYVTCQLRGLAAAGMVPRMDPSVPPSWTTYFATDDADATAARVTEAGGRVVMEPMDVGPLGRMAVAHDPQGNVFGLWQAGQHTGVDIYNEPGAVVWNEAAVDDPAAAREFYGAVFGFRFDAVEGAGDYTTFTTSDRPLGGLGEHQAGSPKGWTVCFSVGSTDAAVDAVTQGGGAVTTAAQDTPFGRFAVVSDAWSAPFSVMQELSG
jgi:predicted enzyme related to lactoylglutathione lyase